jgi:hypothetical protein
MLAYHEKGGWGNIISRGREEYGFRSEMYTFVSYVSLTSDGLKLKFLFICSNQVSKLQRTLDLWMTSSISRPKSGKFWTFLGKFAYLKVKIPSYVLWTGCFLLFRDNHYSNESLTSKNFPLSSKEFVDVFNFLYRKFKLLPHYNFYSYNDLASDH